MRGIGSKRAIVVASVMTAIILGAPVVAGAVIIAPGPPIGPNQFFEGFVNHSNGVTAPAVISVACNPMSATAANVGHPFPGQTVSVEEANVVATATPTIGYTGNDSTIGAFFGTPPPSGTLPPISTFVSFTEYGSEPIPTTLTLPCHGSGQVIFVPLPTVPPARSVSVPVVYTTAVVPEPLIRR